MDSPPCPARGPRRRPTHTNHGSRQAPTWPLSRSGELGVTRERLKSRHLGSGVPAKHPRTLGTGARWWCPHLTGFVLQLPRNWFHGVQPHLQASCRSRWLCPSHPWQGHRGRRSQGHFFFFFFRIQRVERFGQASPVGLTATRGLFDLVPRATWARTFLCAQYQDVLRAS